VGGREGGREGREGGKGGREVGKGGREVGKGGREGRKGREEGKGGREGGVLGMILVACLHAMYSGTSHNGPSHEQTLLDSGQRTSCVLPTDQLCTTAPLITDKQETTPIFHAGI